MPLRNKTKKQKKYGSFSPKIVEIFFCKNPFPAMTRKKNEKKVPMATKPRGEGGALVAGPLRKELFLQLP